MHSTKACGVASWGWFVEGAGIAGCIAIGVQRGMRLTTDVASYGSRGLHRLFSAWMQQGEAWLV